MLISYQTDKVTHFLLINLDNSIISTNITIPTILDDKKEYANKFYNEKIALKLIRKIVDEVGGNKNTFKI